MSKLSYIWPNIVNFHDFKHTFICLKNKLLSLKYYLEKI